MIEIKFQGNSMENILRQIQAFTEKIEVKEVPKRGERGKVKATDRGGGVLEKVELE